jgi:hypothetical protein
MGMSEDDRIRNKNAIHNLAYAHYEMLQTVYKSDAEIASHCVEHLNKNEDALVRNEIHLAILKIVGRSSEKQNT